MKLFQNNVKVPVTKTKRPSFKAAFGRTWDSSTVKIDDELVTVWLDTTWGFYLYFQYGVEKQWYKFKMWSDPMNQFNGKGEYNIDPFDKTMSELTTKIKE